VPNYLQIHFLAGFESHPVNIQVDYSAGKNPASSDHAAIRHNRPFLLDVPIDELVAAQQNPAKYPITAE